MVISATFVCARVAIILCDVGSTYSYMSVQLHCYLMCFVIYLIPPVYVSTIVYRLYCCVYGFADLGSFAYVGYD